MRCCKKSGPTFFDIDKSVGWFETDADADVVVAADDVIGNGATGSLGRSSCGRLTGRCGKTRFLSSILTIPERA